MTSTDKSSLCVILYSLNHFNPERDVPLSGSSAGRIARQVYEAAISSGTHRVIYVDAFDSKTWPDEKPDLVIAILDNLKLAIRTLQPNRILGIAVNYHPLDRVNLVYSAKHLGISWRNLVPSDGIYQEHSSLKYLDQLMIVGNRGTELSFSRRLPGVRTRLTHYKLSLRDHPLKRDLMRSSPVINVLFLMSAIGFRKGADLVFESLRGMPRMDEPRIVFHIVGAPSNEYWACELDKVSLERNDIISHGWMDNKGNAFRDLLATTDLAVFPAREEGLLGALLESIDHGIPSLHSNFVGIDASDPALLLSELTSVEIRGKILSFATLNQEKRAHLHAVQLESLMRQFNSQESIEYIVNDWMKDDCVSTIGDVPLRRIGSIRMKDLLSFAKLVVFFPRLSLGRIRLNYMQIGLSNLQQSNPEMYGCLRRIYIVIKKLVGVCSNF